MFLLLSIFYLMIISVISQSPAGIGTVSPKIDLPPEVLYPGNVITVSPEHLDVQDENELPDYAELLESAENVNITEYQDDTQDPDIEYPDYTENPDDIDDSDHTEDPDDPELEDPMVSIIQGRVVGSYADDGTYAQFYGIPYADTTSGSNRFKAPNPPPVFLDTFIANRRDIKCVRTLGTGYEGTEDCLVANVFTSNLGGTSGLPVIVWVKGKEFDSSYEYEPSFKKFIDQDVVVVTLNYRESVLGFLCLGTETAPGNAGLKDIIAGLHWIRNNIGQFGGDPNEITLIGHGSGAAAVDLVTLSPMATGLINRAIAQSGNALSPWAVSRDNVYYPIQVAEALGHIVTDIEELSSVFERTSVAALMGVINELDLTDNSLAFAPCLERGNLGDIEPFMVKSPFETLVEGNYPQIPLIIGYVDNEGTIRSKEAVKDNWMERMDESFANFLQPDLMFETNDEKTEITENIRTFYFQDNPIDMDHVENYIHYHGDTMILVSALREMRLRAMTNAHVYLYQFSYKGFLGEPFVGPIEVNSAAHSEELAYLFHADTDEIPDRDRTIGDILVERWCWFAKSGAPTSTTSLVPWLAFTPTASNYLRILDNEEINEQETYEVPLENPHPNALSFWDNIYEKHFLDAKGRWDWTEREEDDDEDDNDDGSGNGNGDGDGNNDDDDDDGGSGDGEDGADGAGSGDGGGNAGGSALTTVGYTFTILSLFAILNKIQDSQLLL